MEPTIKIIRPQTYNVKVAPNMQLVERVSRILDSQFTIPGTKIKFGIDPIMSLFPVIGDLITYIISALLIYMMYNHGASRKVVIKIMLNSTLDAVSGSVPGIGTIFDVVYRSNDRNVKLLKQHYFEGRHQGSGNGLLVVVAIVCVVIVAAAGYGMYKLFEAIF